MADIYERLAGRDSESQIRSWAEAIRDDFGLDFAVPQELITVTANTEWGRLSKRLDGVAVLLERMYAALEAAYSESEVEDE